MKCDALQPQFSLNKTFVSLVHTLCALSQGDAPHFP
jgi:hypothetical protein